MQCELAQLNISPLSIRTLNVRLQHIATKPAAGAAVETTAPVVQLDAIWITQLVPTCGHHRDGKGRLRPNKQRIKRPIFIAMGVWLETGRAEVLAWRLTTQESEEEWLAFLTELEDLGVRGENGLELLIHDGGSGLCAALNTVHLGAGEQRCLFHKLRNLYNAIRIADETLSLARSSAVSARPFSAIFTRSGRSSSFLLSSSVTARLSASIAPHSPRQSVVCAMTSAPPSLSLPSSRATLTGR